MKRARARARSVMRERREDAPSFSLSHSPLEMASVSTRMKVYALDSVPTPTRKPAERKVSPLEKMLNAPVRFQLGTLAHYQFG